MCYREVFFCIRFDVTEYFILSILSQSLDSTNKRIKISFRLTTQVPMEREVIKLFLRACMSSGIRD